MDDYSQLISIENLFQAWSEFRVGKRKRADVQAFERNIEDNLFSLYHDVKKQTYQHGEYQSFYVHDPKRRHIHKAQVSDRVIHHLLYIYLYSLFDKIFIYDSYSCRIDKGTHRAVKRLEKFSRKVSRNYTTDCWALKCDIKKFFASVDHEILLGLLRRKVADPDILWLLEQVIASFSSDQGVGKGIPLGNLTSQIFANIYMSELDQFVKHELRIKYYLRYADDFILLSKNKSSLYPCIDAFLQFLQSKLKLELHPKKIILRRLEWGIDFLGYIVLPHYILPITKTKRRLFKKLQEKINSDNFNQSLQSYLGYLGNADSFKLTEQLRNQVWFWRNGSIPIF
jgi:Retron-type reverse transcriptase